MKCFIFFVNLMLKNFVGYVNEYKCCYFKVIFFFFNFIWKLNEIKFKIKLLLENILMLNS